jgi:amiloride-sensitive sodium channel
VLWVLLFLMGMMVATYFILAMWNKWETSPVYMSVDTTAYPISNIPFPAVSICSVNKVVRDKFTSALKDLQKQSDRYEC